MPNLVVIGPRIKEEQRGAAYILPKQPSLNRVKDGNFIFK